MNIPRRFHLSRRTPPALKSSRRRGKATPAIEWLEQRDLLTLIITGLTGDAAGSYTNSAVVSSLNLGDSYRFTAGQGASINVSVTTPVSQNKYAENYTVTLSNYPVSGYSATSVTGSGTITLPQTTGNRSQYYYVDIQGFDLGNGTGISMPYTVKITTGSGEPQTDLAITSATLNPFNNSVQYSYTASNDPGDYTVSAYLSSTPTYTASNPGNEIATQSITTGATSGTGQFNFNSIEPTAAYPYLVVYISGAFENNYTNNSYAITIPQAKSPTVDLNSASLSASTISGDPQINLTYTVTGSDLPTEGTVGFYWASGSSLSNKLEAKPVSVSGLMYSRASTTPYTELASYLQTLGPQPSNASYILVVANAPYADPNHSFIAVPIPSHISINSFVKDSASAPTHSDGDYDLTYQVSGGALPNNPNLTLAVYWATGTTAASIIPDITPVATGQLNQLVGTHQFYVNIAQMINPPAVATNLVAVLDNNHVLPASDESNSALAIDPANLSQYPLGLDSPLSFELQSNAQTIAPSAPTREQRVYLWLKANASDIKSTALRYNIDPVAIAGAIAWEALQDVVLPTSVRSVGPGKVHYWSFNPFATTDIAYVLNNKRYSPVLSLPPGTTLVSWLETNDGAIQSIAAILNAYATEAQLAGGPNLRNGFYIDRSSPHNPEQYTDASILDSYYVGEGNIVPGNPSAGIITLPYAPSEFKTRLSYSDEFAPGTTMGQWVAHNDAFLRLALGLSIRTSP